MKPLKRALDLLLIPFVIVVIIYDMWNLEK